MSDIGNMEKLKNYLVGKGELSYLLDDNNNNGKTLMLSGKWGSGKTHFWTDEIIPLLNDDKNKIPNHYISLYGKTSIEQIKNEVFIKVFESIDSDELIKKSVKTIKGTTNLVSSLAKSVSVFGLSVDISKVTDPIFDTVEKSQDKSKIQKTEEYLNSGAIICFDDFERKSKDIDLNDLFGFISQLTIEFNCKVVIILNDDVFEGEEKKVFSNVKEKTVSKFLYFNPSIDELFESIYSSDEKYKKLDEYKDKILKTIKETEELNARIYIQVLDNLLEWVNDESKKTSDDIVRCLTLVNINFVSYHTIFRKDEKKERYIEKHFNDKLEQFSKNFNSIKVQAFDLNDRHRKPEFVFYKSFDKYFNNFESRVLKDDTNREYKIFLNEYKNVYKSIYFANYFNIAKGLDNEKFQKINNFIESGIL